MSIFWHICSASDSNWDLASSVAVNVSVSGELSAVICRLSKIVCCWWLVCCQPGVLLLLAACKSLADSANWATKCCPSRNLIACHNWPTIFAIVNIPAYIQHFHSGCGMWVNFSINVFALSPEPTRFSNHFLWNAANSWNVNPKTPSAPLFLCGGMKFAYLSEIYVAADVKCLWRICWSASVGISGAAYMHKH